MRDAKGKWGLNHQVEDPAEIWPKIVHYLCFKSCDGITQLTRLPLERLVRLR